MDLTVVAGVVALKAHTIRGPRPYWWPEAIASVAVSILVIYGAFALARDNLDMEARWSVPISMLVGALTLYWLTARISP